MNKYFKYLLYTLILLYIVHIIVFVIARATREDREFYFPFNLVDYTQKVSCSAINKGSDSESLYCDGKESKLPKYFIYNDNVYYHYHNWTGDSLDIVKGIDIISFKFNNLVDLSYDKNSVFCKQFSRNDISYKELKPLPYTAISFGWNLWTNGNNILLDEYGCYIDSKTNFRDIDKNEFQNKIDIFKNSNLVYKYYQDYKFYLSNHF